MRQWNLTNAQPYSLTLAADARLTSIDYFNDHIWRCSLQGGEPPTLMVFTTFGLRARAMRIFPIFIENDRQVYDPQDFFKPPCIQTALPNYLNLLFHPFQGIEAILELLVPHSHVLLGRVKVSNQSEKNREIVLQIAAQLFPNPGEHLTHKEFRATKILAGKTYNLFPVIFIQGGADFAKGSFPALQKRLSLPHHHDEIITWAHVAEDSIEASFDKARSFATFNWSAEVARLEMLNRSILNFYTANPEWDASLFFSQKEALNLFVNAPPAHPHISFVSIRHVDQGFSRRGDGNDYTHFWSGQTPLEVFHLANIMLPSSPEIIRDLVDNFLSIQREDGFIDLKPGMSGQRSQVLATPLLSELAWRVHLRLGDIDWLKKAYPILMRLIRFWFSPENDRDADGIPEWTHPMQLGLFNHPLYTSALEDSLHLDISKTETPSLCAFLYNECQVLLRMAKKLSIEEDYPFLETCMLRMQKAIQGMWNEEYGLFMDWDRDTHLSQPSIYLGDVQPNETLFLNFEFHTPQRILLQVTSPDLRPPDFTLVIHVTGISGKPRIIQISSKDFLWEVHQGYFSSDWVVTGIEKIELIAQDALIQCKVLTYGTLNANLTGILPWWAGVEVSEEINTRILQTILDAEKFWQPFGMPLCPLGDKISNPQPFHHVNMLWNTFCLEGLIRRGFIREASFLFTKLLNVSSRALKQNKCFSSWYDATEGYGRGEHNELSGLLPVSTFLDLLGVHFRSDDQIYLEPTFPFSENITIQYKGLTILRGKEKTTINFPNGQSVIIENDHPQWISMGDSPSPVK